jgi:hypothetical protein
MDKNKEYGGMLRPIAEAKSNDPELKPYINNLDKLLGIKTINSCHQMFGVQFCERHEHTMCHNCNINCDNVKELTLKKKELAINDKDYHWYITAKKKDRDLFIIIGIPKVKKLENVKYTLGRDENNTTILLKGENY